MAANSLFQIATIVILHPITLAVILTWHMIWFPYFVLFAVCYLTWKYYTWDIVNSMYQSLKETRHQMHTLEDLE